jgi:copper(I)-binding protein
MSPRPPLNAARLLATSLVACLLSTACSRSTPQPSAKITITGAVIVQPVSAGAPAPAYFTVHNPTAADDRITAVTTNISTRTLINNSLSDTPTTSGLDIPAATTTALGPFGSDILLLAPAPLTAGSIVTLTVSFQHLGRVSVRATVESVAQAAQTQNQTGSTP